MKTTKQSENPSARKGETDIGKVSKKTAMYCPLPSINGVKFGPTSLSVEGDVDMNQGRNLLKDFLQNASATAWYTGDLLVYLADRHGKGVVAQLAEDLNRDYGTLSNMKSVSAKIPVSLRKEQLSWDHHRLVAKLKTNEQKEKWLNKAIQEEWTTTQLRKKLSRKSKPTAKRKAADSATSDTGETGIPGADDLMDWLDVRIPEMLNIKEITTLQQLMKSIKKLLPTGKAKASATKAAADMSAVVPVKPVAELVADAATTVAADAIKACISTVSPAA